MRTKQAAAFEEQESTWIYLLHQQAPPVDRESSASVAIAQSATLPPATALLGTGTGGELPLGSGPLERRPTHSFPPFVPKQQQVAVGLAAPSAFPSAPWTTRRPHHLHPAAELTGASAALEKYQQLAQGAAEPTPASLLELLPKKRRREDASSAKGLHGLHAAKTPRGDGPITSAVTSTATSTTTSASAKRNCFPKKCDFPMCKNSSRSRGFCYSHGGGRRCRVDGCANGAVSRDLCKRHGGGRRCKVEGCKSSSESGGLCYSHGGGRRCSLAWCSARAKKGGFCALHLADQTAERPADQPIDTQTQRAVGDPQARHSNVVETLLALAKDQSTGQADAAAQSTGSDSAEEPAAQVRPASAYAIASILN